MRQRSIRPPAVEASDVRSFGPKPASDRRAAPLLSLPPCTAGRNWKPVGGTAVHEAQGVLSAVLARAMGHRAQHWATFVSLYNTYRK